MAAQPDCGRRDLEHWENLLLPEMDEQVNRDCKSNVLAKAFGSCGISNTSLSSMTFPHFFTIYVDIFMPQIHTETQAGW